MAACPYETENSQSLMVFFTSSTISRLFSVLAAIMVNLPAALNMVDKNVSPSLRHNISVASSENMETENDLPLSSFERNFPVSPPPEKIKSWIP